MARYYACADAKAQIFIKHDYAEVKDLTKAFLTLLIGVLVASITFSEKIVDVRASSWWSAGAVIVCWILLLAAIASAGSSLALMSRAAADATYWPHVNFRPLENSAVGLLKAAGIFFGSGLVALLVAGVVSLADRKSKA